MNRIYNEENVDAFCSIYSSISNEICLHASKDQNNQAAFPKIAPPFVTKSPHKDAE